MGGGQRCGWRCHPHPLPPPPHPSPLPTVGSITQAVQRARQLAGFALKVEVECGSLAQAREAIGNGEYSNAADILQHISPFPSPSNPSPSQPPARMW